MGCCGGGRPYTPPTNGQVEQVVAPTMLMSVPEAEKVWVEYTGKKEGGFGVVGKMTNINYNIQGPGHKFEVHVKDLSIFQRQRGPAGQNVFVVGTPKPQKIEANSNPPFIAPQPELAQVFQLEG